MYVYVRQKNNSTILLINGIVIIAFGSILVFDPFKSPEIMNILGSGLFSGERFNSSKDFLKSVEEQFGVADASEVGSEEFDLSI
jgi:hypothetical protein